LSRIKNLVIDLKEKFKSDNPYEIAAMMNIDVINWNLHEEINGFYKYDKRNKYIVINSNLNEETQRFVIAHELGHAVLHPRSNTPFLRKNTFFSIDKIEVEANEFAVHLILHNENLENFETKYEILREYGIPFEMERFL
jgi:Zn-dependent peptidase ImmA (M78 family)